MKIKYLAGKQKNQIQDIDDIKGAELVEGGYAEAVVEKSAMETAVDAIENKINDIAVKAAEAAATSTLDKISKGLKSKPTIVVGADGWESDPAAGFKSIGEYLSAVVKMGQGKGVDDRISKYNAKTTFSPMSDATEGSIVPVEYSDVLVNDLIEENDFLQLAFKIPVTTGSSIQVPCDATTSLAAGGGLIAQVVGEGVQMQDQVPATRNVILQLKKLATLIDVTEELLADTNIALPAYLAQKNQWGFSYAIAGGILTSANTAFTGILGATGTIVAPAVPAEVTAAVPAISFTDIAKMYASFYGDMKKAVWVCGRDTFSALMQLTGGGSGNNIYLPQLQGGLKDAPYYTILGIPCIISDVCSAYGTVGDIFLCDMSRYLVALKGGVETASTNALHFDAQSYSFRTTMRITGQPERVSPITTVSGLSLSPYVVLQTRS